MDVIAYWDPGAFRNVPDLDEYVDIIYDAMWFLKRTGETGLGFRIFPRFGLTRFEVSPTIYTEFSLGVLGALVVKIPGNALRRSFGLVPMDSSTKDGLRQLGWLSPGTAEDPYWTLPTPEPLQGFVRRWATTVTLTLDAVFDVELADACLAFERPTAEGRVPYSAPFPDFMET